MTLKTELAYALEILEKERLDLRAHTEKVRRAEEVNAAGFADWERIRLMKKSLDQAITILEFADNGEEGQDD